MRALTFPIIVLILSACTNNNRKVEPLISSDNVIDSFFPVTSFIKGQLISLDSLPLTPLHIIITKEKTDSLWITIEKLKPLMVSFIEPEISETNFARYFKETKFIDQTINSITFTCDPLQNLPRSISLRHWDIYINPSTGNVTKVYLVKEIEKNNQKFTQQLTWKTDEWAKITTLLNEANGKMKLLQEEKFIWSFN